MEAKPTTEEKEPCNCKDDNWGRAFLAYQSSNSDNEKELLEYLAEFSGIMLNKFHAIPYVTAQIGTPPCIPYPQRPCK